MYGGHIVNDFDRLLTNTYLDFYMKEELLEEMSLFPFLDMSSVGANATGAGGANANGNAGSGGGNTSNAALSLLEQFKASPTSASYDMVLEHIDEYFKNETPLIFGLHPNAELGFRTQTSDDLLKCILELSTSANNANSSGGGGGSSGGEGSGSGEGGNASNEEVGGNSAETDRQHLIEGMIQDILEQYPDIKLDTESVLATLEEVGPFQNVIIQESECFVKRNPVLS